MIVLSAQNINVKGDTRSDGEGVEDVREHLCREVSNLLTFEP